jgi:hypothetical protein
MCSEALTTFRGAVVRKSSHSIRYKTTAPTAVTCTGTSILCARKNIRHLYSSGRLSVYHRERYRELHHGRAHQGHMERGSRESRDVCKNQGNVPSEITSEIRRKQSDLLGIFMSCTPLCHERCSTFVITNFVKDAPERSIYVGSKGFSRRGYDDGVRRKRNTKRAKLF